MSAPDANYNGGSYLAYGYYNYGKPGNWMTFGVGKTRTGVISPKNALFIDKKLDNGKAGSGEIEFSTPQVRPIRAIRAILAAGNW